MVMDRQYPQRPPSTPAAPRRAARVVRLAAALAVATATAAATAASAAAATAPQRLAETGLYADFATRTIAGGNLPFSPQYPLWTDGAEKRRWIRIPEGTAIDASDVDAWDFTVGTRVWKEFAFDGRPVETRYMERTTDGTWLYATYQWTKDGADARLAPARGVRAADCRACHEGSPSRVLGFSALQLSPDRDPLAPHQTKPEPGSVDLRALVARGLVRNLPSRLLRTPPRVPAKSPVERAALGYLHGNCSGCHNGSGPLADLGMSLQVLLEPARDARGRIVSEAVATASAQVARFELQSGHSMVRIAPGAPEASLVARRMASRQEARQMPPLGTHLVDGVAVALVREWIRELDPPYRLASHRPARFVQTSSPISTLPSH
jgi:hypothetical protein